jgi:hypothetical protein
MMEWGDEFEQEREGSDDDNVEDSWIGWDDLKSFVIAVANGYSDRGTLTPEAAQELLANWDTRIQEIIDKREDK